MRTIPFLATPLTGALAALVWLKSLPHGVHRHTPGAGCTAERRRTCTLRSCTLCCRLMNAWNALGIVVFVYANNIVPEVQVRSKGHGRRAGADAGV